MMTRFFERMCNDSAVKEHYKMVVRDQALATRSNQSPIFYGFMA